jgi:hypothetical protein
VLLLAKMEAQIEAQIRAEMLQVVLVEMVPCFGQDCLVLDCFLKHSVLRIQMILRDFHHSHFRRFGCYQSFREKCL